MNEGPAPQSVGRWPSRLYAEVAVPAVTAHGGGFRQAVFTYGIPDQLRGHVGPGHAVGVPFRRQLVQGIVTRLTRTSPVPAVRDLEGLVADRPLLTIELLVLGQWMAEHYLAPRFDCLMAMLPPGALARTERRYRRTRAPIDPRLLQPEQLAVLGAFGRDRVLEYGLLNGRAGLRDAGPALARLVADGLLEVEDVHRKAPRPKLVVTVRRLKRRPEEGARPRRRRGSVMGDRVLDALPPDGSEVAWPAVARATGAAKRHRDALEAAGLVAVGARREWRDPLAEQAGDAASFPELTTDQERAWELIAPLLRHGARAWARRSQLLDYRPQRPERGPLPAPAAPEPPPACLVHGVTGSGKTELYLRAVAHVLERSRQAVVLVPEIALAPQTVDRFAERFPGRVGVWHSGLPGGERLDTWQRARDGLLDVIVGSRSAVFAPLPRLGLIVIDEEHASSYKQDRTPRYHARETALRRAALCGAAVLLGSATPSVETFFATQNHWAHRVELPRRVATGGPDLDWGELSPVQVVDMRAELKAGNRSIFSRALAEALRQTLEEGHQAILFLNRRGSATSVSCRDCGHVMACPRCALPLALHAAPRGLTCHHCNHRQTTPMLCPACGSDRIRPFGVGTERVEADVRRLLPEARVLRWDSDTARGHAAHATLLRRFSGREADILVGTQMVAKGLDLPAVTLVGVVAADTSLHLPDPWTRERTFQILTQVAGRAGRSYRGGRVIFQTYRPREPAIRWAACQDYAAFHAAEIAFRRTHGFPPFRRMIRLELVTKSGERAALEAAGRVADALRERAVRLGLGEVDVAGPAPAFFGRVRGKNRWHVVLRAEDPYPLLRELPLGPGWRIDVDPVTLL